MKRLTAWIVHGLPLFRQLPIRWKLLTAFAANLLLMGALGFSALGEMAFMQEKAAWVEDHTIAALRHVDQVEDAFGRYRSLQLEYLVLTNEGDRARLEQDLRQVEGVVAESLSHLRGFHEGEADLARNQALDAVAKAWHHYVAATWQRFLPSARLTNSGTVQPAFSRLNPLHQELLAASSAWVSLNENQARDALGAVRTKYRASRRFVVLGTLSAVVLSAAIGFGLAAHLAVRIGQLSDATRHVADGDLETPLEPQGGDEIQTLAENFNTMVWKLREKREALELRHRELRASLDQQRSLTADLVRRKEESAAADRARAAAEAASQAKSLFLATMSHELRTPLNAMMGYAQLLHLTALSRHDEASRDDLTRLLAAGRHLATVITNILDFSKIEQGKMDVEWLSCDLPTLIQEVVALLEPLAAERGNRVGWFCDAETGTIESDPGKIRQILFNLLSNAAKFTRDGSIEVRCRRLEDRSFALAVADTGIGIADDQLPRLFQAFEQGDSSITRRFGGTGLGLVVSQQLAELLGGHIEATSQAGKGSTFTVFLPASPPDSPNRLPRLLPATPPQELSHGQNFGR